MATRTHDIFTTIHTEGALLPPDLIQRIADGDSAPGGALEGLRPADYHLSGEKINEAVNRAWNVLLGAWKSFQVAQRELPTGDIGTSVTRERWLLPLFRELDYGRLPTARAAEIDGKSYPISHRWNNVPIHLVSAQLDLDKRAPGVAGASAASPHSLLQVYLNRADDVLWGFVSNGRQLRILRDNASLTRQAYVEFDLEAMMNGEVYADFVLLWLLCHQSRVEGERPTDFWLEKWMQTASQEGTRALDQLRDGVQAAIERLGEGFLAHPHNHALRDRLQSGDLIPQDYYRQLLRLVYRLLFLFVAEDRGLLLDPHADETARARYTDFYSTRRLRHLAERFRGTRHHDLFHSLRLVMRLLGAERNGEGRALGLPVLGSYLFSDDAVTDLIGCEIGNRDLLEAVRALAFTEDRAIRALRPVDYKNLGPEELGSVYESLLELHPEITVPARTFALATAGGHERKTTGSYYTPSSLIQALLDSALDPVLAEARAGGEAAILDLKVCDPACGSGHFLIAAAHRIAKALASVRTGEEEPAPDATRTALRDVIGHCIYGVDINEMAVELCKVNLWMEALEPGKPLSFLDHRIQCGNSLLGTTPALMANGIPDEAFQPIEGDDKSVVSGLRKQNRDERKQREARVMQHGLWDAQPATDYSALAAELVALDTLDDATLAGVRAKEARYRALADDPDYIAARLLADAWCAAFVWEKTPDAQMPLTDLFYRRLENDPHADSMRAVRQQIARLAEQYRFFHWHVTFPDVFSVPEQVDTESVTGWDGGFDVVLGNPPWERIKIQEKEFFAERRPDIAAAPNAAARRRMIAALQDDDPALFQAFALELRRAEGESHFVRISERYPLTGVGDVNTYALFTGLARELIQIRGLAGVVIPTGIATDDQLKSFFDDLIKTHSLKTLIGFENEEFLFPGIANVVRFCIFVISGKGVASSAPEFVFYLRRPGQLEERKRFFRLSEQDIALLNPNTKTCPVFRTDTDADLTRSIYARIPILINERENTNPWCISFLRMFDMATDSNLFLDNPVQDSVPLYEAKYFWHFDHRFGSYELLGKVKGKGGRGLPNQPLENYLNPDYKIEPRYWVEEKEFEARLPYTWNHKWFIGFRDVTSAKLERTVIFSLIPYVAVGHKAPLVFPQSPTAKHIAGFLANMNSLILDYVARQKIGGTSMSYFILKQLPVLPPDHYCPDDLEFIAERVLELVYTAWDVKSFAEDIGFEGKPFTWDENRRAILRAELDAYYAKLYGLTRDELCYVLDPLDIYGQDFPGETFRVLKEKETEQYGEYRTQRLVLEAWDRLFVHE